MSIRAGTACILMPLLALHIAMVAEVRSLVDSTEVAMGPVAVRNDQTDMIRLLREPWWMSVEPVPAGQAEPLMTMWSQAFRNNHGL